MPVEDTQREIQILAVFRQLLQAPALGPEQNFFEAGGSSLLAARLVSRLRSAGVLDVPTSAIFAAPTARALTHYARSAPQVSPTQVTESTAAAPSDTPVASAAADRGARQRAAFGRLRTTPSAAAPSIAAAPVVDPGADSVPKEAR